MVYPISPEYCGIDTWNRFMSRDMAVSIVTRLWVRQQSNRDSIIGRVKEIFSSLKCPLSRLFNGFTGQATKLTTKLNLVSRLTFRHRASSI